MYATGALPENHEVRIHVQAVGSVIGLNHGQDDWVYPSHRVEMLISLGHLIWLDEPEENDGC